MPEPRAIRDAARPVDDLRVRAAPPGVIDRIIASTRSISRSSKLSIGLADLPHAGQHPEHLAERAHLADGLQLSEEVLEREVGAALQLARPSSRPASASNAFSACSMSVSMSPMPRMREAIRSGWKTSKSSSFSPLDANITGRPVTLRDRQRRAAAGVAVELGQDDPVEADAVEEGQCGRDGVLADHRVDDEQGLVGRDGVPDVGGLLHQLGVDAEPAGGVDDDDVVQLAARACSTTGARPRPPGRRRRCPARGAKTATPARSPTTCSWSTALGRCRSAATSSGWWPWLLSQRASLPASVVFPDPCRPASMITVGGCLGEAQPAGLAAEDRRRARR